MAVGTTNPTNLSYAVIMIINFPTLIIRADDEIIGGVCCLVEDPTINGPPRRNNWALLSVFHANEKRLYSTAAYALE